LISNYRRRLVSLPGYGLEIVQTVPLDVAERSTAAGISLPSDGGADAASGARRRQRVGAKAHARNP
jgi:hypothetical protein